MEAGCGSGRGGSGHCGVGRLWDCCKEEMEQMGSLQGKEML